MCRSKKNLLVELVGLSSWLLAGDCFYFAFNVDSENFEKAYRKYDPLGIDYDFQDHTYFHSIYTSDPDGHRVETDDYGNKN